MCAHPTPSRLSRAHRGMILRLPPNRVWRTYPGGRVLDAIEGKPNPADGPFPEDWIGSTVKAVNPNRGRSNEGLARVRFGDTEAVLADVIEADPEYFLGATHLARYGCNPMILVKYLDSAVRLPFQVHPTVEFARRRLESQSGKTEAYYVLAIRPEAEDPFVYLGFQRPPTREMLGRMIREQDIRALERCFDPIPVKPHDILVVPGGFPHAIGPGIFLVEVMEPTDLVARIEFQAGGQVIPEEARFLGRDLDFALDMFSSEPAPLASVQSRWRCKPHLIEERDGLRRESVVDERVTDRFNLARAAVAGSARWTASGFVILLVLEGGCTVATPNDRVTLKRFDRILAPDGIGPLQITARDGVLLLECRPPRAL